jgi:hypothetical protein
VSLQFDPKYGAGVDVFNALVRQIDRHDQSYKTRGPDLMRILVIGAGAIGAGWPALARGGADVTVLARGAWRPLRRPDTSAGTGARPPTPPAIVAADLGKPDAVVLAVKTNGFADAVASAPFSRTPLVVTAMNGRPGGSCPVTQVLCRTSAWRLAIPAGARRRCSPLPARWQP